MKNNIEEIKVTVCDCYSIVFAVDHNLVMEKIKDWHLLNDFWGGAGGRLFMADGDIVNAVLGYLAQVCFGVQVSDGLNTYGVMTFFDDAEGWPKMDGSFGILIKSMDLFEFNFQPSVDISKKKISEMPAKPKGNWS